MRTLFIALVVMAAPALSQAQDDWHLRSAQGKQVTLVDATNREWRGRLLRVSAEDMTVDLGTSHRRFDFADVARVQAHGDKVWDGGLKGAIFGAAMAVVLGGGARVAGKAAISYAFIGIGLDALSNCRHVVYPAPAPAPSASVTLRW